ncbi:thioredoxin family protein [Neoaquamicrobium sediminum]|uniref:thioredoxin family protein n=1 Tax=Neoaquamicrobium sediminum TaxID=1849104 RepID=UPI001565203D|nr:thioredoxin family protein [Mesorhizobium sediminum]NRC57371.1 hypothetical protein [Mesorhizobium sediminum]
MATRRSVLVGLVAAGTVVWSQRPAAAASSVTVTDLESWREALGTLAPRYRHALVDIRADWCAPCLRMEREVFPHPAVRRMLEDVALIKVDVTPMDGANRELLAHLRADGPPTIFIVETASGGEYARTRSIGGLKRSELVRRLRPFAGR